MESYENESSGIEDVSWRQKRELDLLQCKRTLEKHSKKTKKILRSAMKGMERKGRETKERLTNEFRSALKEMEKKKKKTKEILSKATTEILYAMEEMDQKSQKSVCHVGSGRVIPAEAVPRFCELYKYNASCGSVLELLFFQKFWIWLSKWVPDSIAPCAITFSGLSFFAVNICVLMYYSPDATHEVPGWTLCLSGLAVFVYQTFDALDGKQCSKNQETHLEEFADHGCDSFTSTLTTLSIVIALQLGDYPALTMAFLTLSLATFYSTHWQTHVTDIVVFGKLDVTEAETAMILVNLLSAAMGQQFWRYNVPHLNLELRLFVIMVAMAFSVWTILRNIRIIVGGPTPLDDIVQIERRRGIRILYPVVPFIFFAIFIQLAGTRLFLVSPSLFFITFGFVFTKILIKLQISNLGKIDCELLDSIFLVPSLLCLNERLDILPQHTALISALVFCSMDVLRFVSHLFWDICDYQDVYIFSLKYSVGHPKNKAGGRGVYINGLNNEQVISKFKNKLNRSNVK